MTVIGVNLQRVKDVDILELSNEYMEMLRERRCSIKELPINRKPLKKQLNVLVDIASYAFLAILLQE